MGTSVQPVINMSSYNDRYGVCIDASCSVQLEGGEARLVGDLVKGDKVLSIGGDNSGTCVAEVLCLVRTRCIGGHALLVHLSGGVHVTPFHPVYYGGQWRFPAELAEATDSECEAVCSV